jgi:ArsR family transcriptional regulator
MSDGLSAAFKALGNPHRLAIVRRLLNEAIACDAPTPSCCGLDAACCDFSVLVEDLDVGKSTVSHHVKELHQAGLVERHRDGRRVYCRISEERLNELRDFLSTSSQPASGR